MSWLMQSWGLARLRPDGQASNRRRGELMLQPESRGCWKQSSLFLREVCLFSLKPSNGWMRPTHVMEYTLLYSESNDLNGNVI